MLHMTGLHFIGCGSHSIVNTSYGRAGIINPNILSALSFVNGSQLTLTNINVSDTKAAGLYIFNVQGHIKINSCNIRNSLTKDLYLMGGNVFLFDREIQNHTDLDIEYSLFDQGGYNIGIYNCSKEGKKGFIFSAGLVLIVGSPRLLISISSTNLTNSRGCEGGNMALNLYNIAAYMYTTPMVTIKNTYFENGDAKYGGGLFISFYLSHLLNSSVSYSQAFTIINSTFRNNSAKSSGGGIYLQWEEILKFNNILDMSIIGSTFERYSIGKYGSGGIALHYRTFIHPRYASHSLVKFRFNLNVSQCHFHDHIASSQHSESGVILAKAAPYLAMDGINITSNNCTALLAIDSTLIFSGSSTISNNTAQNGAGIRFCSGSVLYLTPYTTLLITNNQVWGNGGGILVNSKCLVNVPMCFYQYTNLTLQKTVNVIIRDNHAHRAGDNLYGGSIDYCYQFSQYYYNYTNYNYKYLLEIPENSRNVSSISSNPEHVCFIDDYYSCGKSKDIKIYPGETKLFKVQVVGQANGSVPGTVRAEANGGVLIHEHNIVQKIRSKHGGTVEYAILLNSFLPSNGSLSLMVDVDIDSGR